MKQMDVIRARSVSISPVVFAHELQVLVPSTRLVQRLLLSPLCHTLRSTAEKRRAHFRPFTLRSDGTAIAPGFQRVRQGSCQCC